MSAKKQSSSDQQKIHPVYAVYGKDRRGISQQIELITDNLLGEDDHQVCLGSYDGDEIALADVLDELRTLPFLAQRRLVVIKNADSFVSAHREALEKYLEEPSPNGVLLLALSSFPANTRLAKRVKKIGQIYNCEPVQPRDLRKFLVDYAKNNHNTQLTPQAAALLIDAGGDDYSILCNEIDKLVIYLADQQNQQKRIEPADVQELVINNRQYNVFNVIDAMTLNQAGLALQRLGLMLQQDREAHFKAVGAFAWHFRRLYNARVLLDKRVGEQAIIQQLRLWSQVNAFMRQVKTLRIERIARCLQQLLEIDFASKTGGNVQTGLENLIMGFCRGII